MRIDLVGAPQGIQVVVKVISFLLAQIKYLAMRHMGVASMSKLRGPAWAHSVCDGA